MTRGTPQRDDVFHEKIVREQPNQMPPIKQHYLWWFCHEHPECREDYGRAAKRDERHSEIPHRVSQNFQTRVA
ncbi:hypothetical protein L596_000580 [Steinernema carpocapsae]|uniref:Uncharacterized protein n=1 Tax=Steinernema carpocapsae TaxID=34508 RepID=A0A4U8UJW7_STECR|nr:hypothetical protein L596_000580 [Steinernema carpocapsae]